MSLPPGSTLGPYTILSQIGAGGMGIVYKARDPKLGRLVAIKLLPTGMGEDPVLVARFEREAKAIAALSHPNVLGIFDFGQAEGTLYAVMELLEGENLRERLRAGALPTRRALDIAAQVALGLAASHDKGILHRDIKPENIFICKDGQVKVLDFGLAKAMPSWNPDLPPLDFQLTAAQPAFTDLAPKSPPAPPAGASNPETAVGTVMGTLGYMSPEQIRGEDLDARSDIFSFGVVLYELLSGQPAFRRDTAALTFEAILTQDPPDLRSDRGPLPAVVEDIVAHCLEKRPEARFQSMRDIAFALQHLDTITVGGGFPAHRSRRKILPWLLGAGATLLLGAAFLRWTPPPPVPVFHRVSAAHGTLESAFFGPDGRTIFFSARIQGRKPELFVLAPDSDGPKSLGIADALLLGVSEAGELALLRNPTRRFGGHYCGLLAQAPGGGGSVKEILEDVSEAAWDGRSMALLAMDDKGGIRVEFPSGHTALQEDGGATGVKGLRLAPDGTRLALIHNDSNRGCSDLLVITRKGETKSLFTKPGDSLAQSLTGLAWAPGGELWFSEWEGDQTTLWALSMRGRKRLVWRGEGAKQLMDISATGRVLMASQRVRRGVLVQREGATREISILDGTQAAGLSADGRTLLLLESPSLDGGTAQDQAYLYRMDQDTPIKLARGNPLTLSPDGKELQLAVDFLGPRDLDGGATAAFQQAGLDPARILDSNPPPYLYFMPTGPGRPRVFPLPRRFEGHGTAYLLGPEVIFQGQEKEKLAWYRWIPGKGEPEPFTPEGLGVVVAGLSPISPDGARFIATGNARDWFIVPVRGGGAPQPIRGLGKGERIIGWTGDGRGLFIRTDLATLPVQIWRLDLASATRTALRTFMPPDPAGHLQIRSVFLTPDAKTVAYTYDRKLGELFQVEGLAK
jgi:tRNA A-37 threonylcarbamoyl transferase component Bud32